MSIPKPNSVAIKVVKTTGTDALATQSAKFPTISTESKGPRIQDLHPNVKGNSENKTAAAVEKPKVTPQAVLIPKENGIFEIHVTCSCGEVHIIECESVS